MIANWNLKGLWSSIICLLWRRPLPSIAVYDRRSNLRGSEQCNMQRENCQNVGVWAADLGLGHISKMWRSLKATSAVMVRRAESLRHLQGSGTMPGITEKDNCPAFYKEVEKMSSSVNNVENSVYASRQWSNNEIENKKRGSKSTTDATGDGKPESRTFDPTK